MISLYTQYRVYCDGAVHAPLEGSSSKENPTVDALALMRRAGWVRKRDGRTLCPQHQDRKANR